MEREDFWLIAAFQGAKMRQKSGLAKKPAEQIVKDIRRATRRQFSAEEKIRIARPALYYGEARNGAPLGPERRRLRMDPLSESGGRGTPSPTQTLDRGWGSCRDFGVLFVEAARCLGFLEGTAPAAPARNGANAILEPYMFWRLAIVDLIIAHSDFPSLPGPGPIADRRA
jgi:hypothetical protein